MWNTSPRCEVYKEADGSPWFPTRWVRLAALPRSRPEPDRTRMELYEVLDLAVPRVGGEVEAEAVE